MSKRKSEGVKCWAVQMKPMAGGQWAIWHGPAPYDEDEPEACAIFLDEDEANTHMENQAPNVSGTFNLRVIPVMVTPIPPKKAKVRRGKVQ